MVYDEITPRKIKREMEGVMFLKKSIIAGNIRAIVDERGYKHAVIAKRAGYTRQQFSDMLTGRKLILADDCFRICDAIGCSYNDLFRRPEEQGV